MAVPRDILAAQKFRATTVELERLVALRSQFLDAFIDITGVGKAILKKIEILKSYHFISTKVDCLHDIERLGEIRIKIRDGTLSMQDGVEENHHVLESDLQGGGVLDEIVKMKLGALIRVCEGETESERVYLLERLAELARKLPDSRIHSTIADTIKTLTQSMFSTPSPRVRAVSISSDGSDSRIIFSPDDNGSTSSVEDDRVDKESVLKDQVEDLQRYLRRARADIAALGKEVDVRDVQIGRLTAQLASFAPHTTDLPVDETKQDVTQEVKGLVADNARLAEELASARKTLDQMNPFLRPRMTPYQPPPPLPKSDFNIEVPLVGEGTAWPGRLPARPAEKRHISNGKRNSGRPLIRSQPTRTAYQYGGPPFLQPQFLPKPNGNSTTPNWPNFDIPTHSAWPVPNAADHERWDERSTGESWGGWDEK